MCLSSALYLFKPVSNLSLFPNPVSVLLAAFSSLHFYFSFWLAKKSFFVHPCFKIRFPQATQICSLLKSYSAALVQLYSFTYLYHKIFHQSECSLKLSLLDTTSHDYFHKVYLTMVQFEQKHFSSQSHTLKLLCTLRFIRLYRFPNFHLIHLSNFLSLLWLIFYQSYW